MLLAAEPKGAAPPLDLAADPIVMVDELRVHFPIRKGLMRRVVGAVKAVDGISLTVREGQTVGVVGESGSGKTTLGLAILRLISSQGRIAYLGKPIERLGFSAMRPLRRDMQVVFQDPYGSLSPRMTVAEIVGEGLALHRRDVKPAERREIVARALAETGLDPATMDATRTSSPAASASASPSPGPWCWSRASSCSTSRRRRSTCPCRPRSSTSCATCRCGAGSPTCSSRTT